MKVFVLSSEVERLGVFTKKEDALTVAENHYSEKISYNIRFPNMLVFLDDVEEYLPEPVFFIEEFEVQ